MAALTPVLAAITEAAFSQVISGASSATPRRARVRPTDPGWPSEAAWRRLNVAVGGNLIKTAPLFSSCAADPGDSACRKAMQNMHNPFYLGDQPSGTQVSGWLDAWSPAASTYAVKAHATADVVAAVNFARTQNLRVVIKGTGHSYLGTSNAPDSLLIWTRAMNRVTLHDRFVPTGCADTVAPTSAVTSESGAMWIDLYDAVTTGAGRYVQGGGCTDVGVAGLIQSGGFGSMSKTFGTAASSLLEAEIVCADGRVYIANACTNPELFWALKGGGGGSWGVVTRVALRTYELPNFFGAAWGKITARSDDAYRKLLARFFDFYGANLLNPHWGEGATLGRGNALEISMVCQAADKAYASDVWKPFFDWVSGAPQDYVLNRKPGADAEDARAWWRVPDNDSMIPDSRAGAPPHHGWWKGDQDQVGLFLHGYDSLWLPISLLQPNGRPRLLDALFAASRLQKVRLHFNKGLAGAPTSVIAAAQETATNPAVCTAFALAIIADGEGPAFRGLARPAMDLAAAHEDARRIDAATAELRKIVPNAGSYVSESNYFNASWQQAYWGSNYPRLRAVKDKYDPDGLFFVHHGVGSEDWSADGFTRLRS
jgi:FAD/FMN-containing dehydrogenase